LYACRNMFFNKRPLHCSYTVIVAGGRERGPTSFRVKKTE
jgi:hypothetical protein